MTIPQLLGQIKGILDAIIPFIYGLTLLVVIWGIFTYVTHGGEEEKRTEAKQFILYGIIGLFLMVSVVGMVNILVGTFSLDKEVDATKIPRVPTFCPPSTVTPRPAGC